MADSSSSPTSKFARHPYQPGDDLNACGKLIRQVRMHHGWTQDNFAGQCAQKGWHIDHLLIAKIESGVRAVSDWELMLLCKVLGVFPDEMLGFRPMRFTLKQRAKGRRKKPSTPDGE